MKAFIWNTDYEVLVAVAKTADDARQFLRAKIANDLVDVLTDEKVIELNLVAIKGASELLTVKYFMQAFEKEPDYVIELGQAIIYKHTNL